MSTGGFLGGGGAAGGTGLDGIPIIGTVVSFLTEIFSQAGQIEDLARATDQVEQQAWSNTLNLAGWAFGAFGDVLHTIGSVIASLGKLLEGLFGSVIWGFIKNLFRHILDWIAKLRNWIRVHIAAWREIQRQLDQQRAMYFRKVIDIVQRIRKVLLPFRLLHLKFAQALDARLVGIESDLGVAWAKLARHDAQVLGVLNDIIDPRQLMRPGHMLGSVGLMVSAIHGAIGALDVRALLCLNPSTAASPLVAPWSTTQTLLLADIQHSTGDYAAQVALRDVCLAAYSSDLGIGLPL